MKKINWLVILALGVFLLIFGACTKKEVVESSSPSGKAMEGISVSGEGKETVSPDLAVLSLGVESKAATVVQAQRQATTAMDAIIAALKAKGVVERDIKTIRFSIYPYFEGVGPEGPVQKGFTVAHMVAAKIRKVGEVGGIIDAAVAAGGDLTRMEGINFTVEDEAALLKEARGKAVADAKSKAEQLAQNAGVKLGKPLSIAEGTVVFPLTEFGSALGKGGNGVVTPISPGEAEVQVNVQILYAIE
ncbi:MAG: SIMPL domain-containing protein [Chloroflexi bacterium]|nr:SIMPL domain-containing protein [Chloroflexota bacterium]